MVTLFLAGFPRLVTFLSVGWALGDDYLGPFVPHVPLSGHLLITFPFPKSRNNVYSPTPESLRICSNSVLELHHRQGSPDLVLSCSQPPASTGDGNSHSTILLCEAQRWPMEGGCAS